MARKAGMAAREMGETAKLPARIEFWRSADKRATTQTHHHRGGSPRRLTWYSEGSWPRGAADEDNVGTRPESVVKRRDRVDRGS